MKTMKDDDRLQDSARFIVSKASAGSGKTFQLVLIYLTLALSVDDNLDERSKRRALEKRFTRILAITFTNAAVNEMKQRILQELAAICDLDTAKRPLIEEKLCKTTGLAVDELRWRAKIVHNAPDTSSYMNTRSISKSGGISTFRSSVVVNENAVGSKSSVSCESLMLDDISRSDTIPAMDIKTDKADIGHEARIGRISDEAV